MKKEYKSLLILGLVFLLSVGINTCQKSFDKDTPITATPITAPSFSEAVGPRQAIVKEFLDAFQLVADKTGDQQAKDNLQMLREKNTVVIPDEKGFTYLSNENDTIKPIRIIPLIPDDSQYSYWKNELNSDAAAAFETGSGLLILKDTMKISAFYKGTQIAHESEHARRYLNNPSRKFNILSIAKEESEVYAFHNRLIAKAGGSEYITLLQKITDEISPQIKTSDDSFSYPILPYYHEFDKMFGPALSSEEEQFRAFLFEVDVMYRYFEKTSPDKSTDLKTLFMKNLYEPKN